MGKQRKQNRLGEYDYSQAGCYFVTVCTRNRELLFWGKTVDAPAVGADIIRPVPLNKTGQVVEQAICNISEVYDGVVVEKYVVMPNHVHLILVIRGGRMVSAPTVSTIVGGMKRWASRECGRPLWQKSFYDHIVRDENDFMTRWNYIDTNPARWQDDEYCEG